ncbi:hypothetical protein K438DRAFT_1791095 [Mycena galopus ATCC 62051]|nr:hypothetical protein K438DRAFT_1791095 [Mycena galopus ATCC 62051]
MAVGGCSARKSSCFTPPRCSKFMEIFLEELDIPMIMLAKHFEGLAIHFGMYIIMLAKGLQGSSCSVDDFSLPPSAQTFLKIFLGGVWTCRMVLAKNLAGLSGGLPSAAPVLVFLEEFRAADGVKDLPVHVVGDMLALVLHFRQQTPSSSTEAYINNFVVTLAVRHIGRLWTRRERVGGPDREATDRSIACFAAWMRMTTGVSLLETTYAADVDLELILVLNIGIALHNIDKEVRMSMLIHPFFQLPALMHHWGNTGAFISHGAVKYARFVMVEPGRRDQNMTRMLNAMCAQMHPALIEFVKYIG